MNYQWGYLFGPKSELKNILPINYENKGFTLSSLQIHPNHDKYYENAEILINPKRLFYFLEKGYFSVLEKKEGCTIVAFYQPIGNVFVETQDSIDTINTATAKITINEDFEVTIVPYNVTYEL